MKQLATRILIIYEKMGMGHLRMARIIEEMLRREDVEIIIRAGSDLLGASDIQTVVNVWNYFIRRNWIRSVDLLINFACRLLVLPVGEITHSTASFEEIDPHIIICTADVYNRRLGALAARRGIPFYIFITEISIFIDLVSPHAVHLCYFEETCRAVRSFDFSMTYFRCGLDHTAAWTRKAAYVLRFYYDYILKGYKNSIFRDPGQTLPRLNEARCRAVGPLAERKYFTAGDAASLKKKYGLPDGADTVLAASGSLGGRFLFDVLRSLRDAGPRLLNLLLMCGNDRETYQQALAFRSTGGLNILPFGYTNEFDEFLEMADCVVMRPSAGVFMESLIKKKPVITFDLATSNDKGTLSIVRQYQVGEVCGNIRELAAAVNTVLEHKNFYRKNIERLLDLYPTTWEEKKTLLRELVLQERMRGIGGNY